MISVIINRWKQLIGIEKVFEMFSDCVRDPRTIRAHMDGPSEIALETIKLELGEKASSKCFLLN